MLSPDIRANLEDEARLSTGSYADCFKANETRILFRTLTGIFLQAWQQLTGVCKSTLTDYHRLIALSDQLHLLLWDYLLLQLGH
jgi:hypothetical protein